MCIEKKYTFSSLVDAKIKKKAILTLAKIVEEFIQDFYNRGIMLGKRGQGQLHKQQICLGIYEQSKESLDRNTNRKTREILTKLT